MATEADLAAYVARVRHQYIDVDGVFGAQCWDQWSHYAMWLGVPAWPTYTNAGGTRPHGGYACNVYHNARAAGLTQWFDILPASATPRAGDVAFWEYGSAWYPWSHVATVLAVTHGGRMLRCLTQNPGAVQIADLTLSGIIGYLRPRALTTGSPDASRTKTLTASEKEDLMASKNAGFWFKRAGKQINIITNAGSGFYHEFESANGKYNSGIARAYGTGTFEEISESQANAIKRDCALLRQGK
ncbi:CHAP domain-containing protein [Leucobacter tenebrionis]|uniref:CHAP domain-containing protein n=1 Tax=Leucobacter tenebrionis TaxID=2873270 RepID=UPI001CA6C9BC|nr:CHAP domain-containing protein [Leucobacter tenebrionis]QZY52934.1 CHAP domain-containing protein [Leucobacter tenebrionis]